MSSKHQVKRYTVRTLLLAGIAAGSLAAAPAAEASARPVMGHIVAGPSEGKPVMGRIATDPSTRPLMGRIATGTPAKKAKKAKKAKSKKGGTIKITRGFIINS